MEDETMEKWDQVLGYGKYGARLDDFKRVWHTLGCASNFSPKGIDPVACVQADPGGEIIRNGLKLHVTTQRLAIRQRRVAASDCEQAQRCGQLVNRRKWLAADREGNRIIECGDAPLKFRKRDSHQVCASSPPLAEAAYERLEVFAYFDLVTRQGRSVQLSLDPRLGEPVQVPFERAVGIALRDPVGKYLKRLLGPARDKVAKGVDQGDLCGVDQNATLDKLGSLLPRQRITESCKQRGYRELLLVGQRPPGCGE